MKNLNGLRFNRWIVVSFQERRQKGTRYKYYWNCKCDCGATKIVESSSLKRNVSCGCLREERLVRGQGHHLWKEKDVGYSSIHSWLRRNFGKANKCEKCNSSNRVQWALLKDKEYERKRENFWQLCCLCHLEYDGTKVKAGWNRGRAWTLEQRDKISKGTKIGMQKAGYNVNLC